MTFANIESRADNQASIALARSLGFVHDPENDFTMPVAGAPDEAAFHCLRADMDVLRQRASQALRKSGLHEVLSLMQGLEFTELDVRQDHPDLEIRK